jgi:phosphoglycerate dehydrogenase-like enzyme
MKNDTILVLGDPAPPQLERLQESLAGETIVAGSSARKFTEAAGNASVIFNWSAPLPLLQQVFSMCPNLRWVHSRSVGLEKSLFLELIESPVTLTNGIGVFSPSLGEWVVGAILYFAKDFRRLIRNQQAGVWKPFDVWVVEGKTVGIIGYGDIGRAAASRLRPLGMKVLALRRHASTLSGADTLVDQMYGPDQRVEMISRCDYIVVATPLTSETRGMIGEQEIAAMKPTAVLINVGRGPVVNEGALVRALSEGRIKGAALDVFDQEPLPSGHPFYPLENVLLSPHCADNTPDWLDQSMQLFIEQFERFRKGEPLLNVVNKKLGY